jgi:sucrose phosphorylase
VHDVYATHQRLADRGYWTYDFVLPGLLLDAFYAGRADLLAAHLARSPSKQFTTLDCHDGIPVRPDLDGLLQPAALQRLVKHTVASGGNVNRMLSSVEPNELDAHQLNCTYYAALAGDDDRYVAARAIQLFARGIPQIYYVGLLAGENDHAAVQRTGEGRAINRHNYSTDEVQQSLERPVVRRLVELIELRNAHPAFDGRLHITRTTATALRMRWQNLDASCSLRVDLATGAIDIDHTAL